MRAYGLLQNVVISLFIFCLALVPLGTNLVSAIMILFFLSHVMKLNGIVNSRGMHTEFTGRYAPSLDVTSMLHSQAPNFILGT